MSTLRLILGDQLNPEHSWFSDIRPDVVYVLMEIHPEMAYVLHHAQKILAIVAGMRAFAQQLKAAGHRVRYVTLDDPSNRQSFADNLDALTHHYGATHFEYQEPDEWRLDQQLQTWAQNAQAQDGLACQMCSSEHFYTERGEAATLFPKQTSWLMERFYRKMRVRHRVLLASPTDDRPAGGKWNFDPDNRKAWRGTPPLPADWRTPHDQSALWQSLCDAGVRSFGDPQADQLAWPLNRQEALQHLDAFIAQALPQFGEFQDALTQHGWRVFHSLLSFALNTKMLNPREVVTRAEQAWESGHAPLAAVEGFIRQILGWREYVRGVYWAHMPGYVEHNALDHTLPLPDWFWTGRTQMACMAHAIGQSLTHAYAHHIQRLMVIGNFALLAGLSPQAVHQWYLGVYIDAFEWVELPNTLGMSQFADGGMLATKPYVSSASYLHRMGDHCKGCHYQHKDRLGPQACPFNTLYWDFHLRHATRLQNNPRLAMVYRNLKQMDAAAVQAIQAQASTLRERLNTL